MSLIIPANSLAGGGYAVDNSLRFNSASSDSLTRTTSGAGTSNQKFTMSLWIKKSSNDSAVRRLIELYNTSSFYVSFRFRDDSSNRLDFYSESNGASVNLRTNRSFRDVSAWYHLMMVVDTTLATADDRMKMYVNGVQETSFALRTNPSLNENLDFNNSGDGQYVGRAVGTETDRMFNGYIAETYFIDGQALTPTDFGEFDEDSGIWKPIAYSGTYGTNGFFLEFQSSGALGTDSSGNGNNFTVNNLTSIDQTTDTPTNNFATLNPLNYSSVSKTYSFGNTAITASDSGSWNATQNNIYVRNGKWYMETKITSVGSYSAIGVGFNPFNTNASAWLGSTYLVGEDAGSYGWRNNGARPQGGSSLSSWGTNDILMIAMDMDNLKVYFGKNGSWENSGVPTSGATGTGSIGNLTANEDYLFVICPRGGATSVNFGNPSYAISSGNTDGNDYGNFEYAVPTGYLSLCTKNISEVNS